jgi:hypothetical protein
MTADQDEVIPLRDQALLLFAVGDVELPHRRLDRAL